jgi:hypothetical protein
MAHGCDFVLEVENWNGHLQALKDTTRAAGKCAAQAANNCNNILLP